MMHLPQVRDGVWTPVLAPTDFSECAIDAVQLAGRLVRSQGGRLVLLHAVARCEEATRRSALELLEAIHARDLPGVDVEPRVVVGESPAEVICSVAEDIDAGLVVVGATGQGGGRRGWTMGGVAERVARHAPHCVLVVPPMTARARLPLRVLVATDFSVANAPLGADVTVLTRSFDPRVTVLHVEAMGGSARKTACVADLERWCRDHVPGVEVHPELIVTDVPVADAILDYARAQRFDLIMVATRGGTQRARFALGSVAERVLRGAHCPVWVTRTGASAASLRAAFAPTDLASAGAAASGAALRPVWLTSRA